MSKPSKEKAVCRTCQNMELEIVRCGRNIFYCMHPEAKTECLPHRIITQSRESEIPTKTAPKWCPLNQKEGKKAMPEHTEQKEEIVICKHCGKPEYWGKMRWLSGWCACRNCYRSLWEDQNHKKYTWDDLDGPRPTMEEYKEQEARKCGNTN